MVTLPRLQQGQFESGYGRTWLLSSLNGPILFIFLFRPVNTLQSNSLTMYNLIYKWILKLGEVLTGGGTKVCSEKLHQEAHGRAQRPDHSQEDDSQGNIGLSVASFKSLSRWRGRGERHQIQLDDVLCPPLARGLCRCFTNRRRHPSVHQSPSLEAPLVPARMVRARICG